MRVAICGVCGEYREGLEAGAGWAWLREHQLTHDQASHVCSRWDAVGCCWTCGAPRGH